MAAVDSPQPRSSGKKGKGHRRPKRRIGVRIDMTPMVDVAFLLLIFFMVTTVFRKPQALEINLPPNKEQTAQIAASNVLQLDVLSEERMFWKRGQKEDPWQRTTVSGLTDILKPLKGNDKIVVLIKIDRNAKFNSMVSIIDQLDIANLGRFSILEIDEKEKAEVEKL